MEKYQEIWEDLCYKINYDKGSKESAMQYNTEFYFESLGWKKRRKEIDRPSIHFGSSNYGIPDIVLCKDGEYQLVVELKRYSLGINDKHKEQLQSYMRALEIEFGILLGNTLQIYFDDKTEKGNMREVCEIKIDEKSKLGIKLTELLAKENFSQQKFKEFCKEQMKLNAEENELEEKIKYLTSNEGVKYIRDLLLREYPEKVIDDIEISIHRKFVQPKSVNYTKSFSSPYTSPYSKPFSKPIENNVLDPNLSIKHKESVQDWVKRVLTYLYHYNKLDEQELRNLQDSNYCKHTFGLQYALLIESEDENDITFAGHKRYWTKFRLGERYFVCSQWWSDKSNTYITKFGNWINKVNK